MATIGTLALNVVARTRRFERGMRRSSGVVTNFASTVLATTRRVAGLAGALTTLAGGAGLVLLTRRAFSTMDATAKLADRIGATTEGLVGLQHAADLAGVSHDSLGRSMERMVRRVGQAERGTGEANRALEQLNISARELTRMRADAAFTRIAQGISELGTRSEQAAVAADIFGRSGVELVNILAQGEEGIAKARAEAERLGLTFSDEAAAKIQMANDAMTRMRGIMAGVGRTIAIQVAPFVMAAAEAFVKLGSQGVTAGSLIAVSLDVVARQMDEIVHLADSAVAAFDKAGRAADIQPRDGIFSQAPRVQRFFDEFLAGIGPTAPPQFTTDLDEMIAALDKGGDAFQRLMDSGRRRTPVQDWLDDVRRRAEEMAEQIRNAAHVDLDFDFPGMPSRDAGFRQIVRSRAAVGGPSTSPQRTQEVRVGGEVLELLRRIENRATAGIPGLMN